MINVNAGITAVESKTFEHVLLVGKLDSNSPAVEALVEISVMQAVDIK